MGPLYIFLFLYPLPLHQSEVSFLCNNLDDVTIGGDLDNILHNLRVMKKAKVLDLSLNNEKSEIIHEDATVRGTIVRSLPGAQVILTEKATLLGSPFVGITSIDASLKEKTNSLHLMGARFKHMSAHDSLILLRHSFCHPKITVLAEICSLFPVS